MKAEKGHQLYNEQRLTVKNNLLLNGTVQYKGWQVREANGKLVLQGW